LPLTPALKQLRDACEAVYKNGDKANPTEGQISPEINGKNTQTLFVMKPKGDSEPLTDFRNGKILEPGGYEGEKNLVPMIECQSYSEGTDPVEFNGVVLVQVDKEGNQGMKAIQAAGGKFGVKVNDLNVVLNRIRRSNLSTGFRNRPDDEPVEDAIDPKGRVVLNSERLNAVIDNSDSAFVKYGIDGKGSIGLRSRVKFTSRD
jgi:hypothetical protein